MNRLLSIWNAPMTDSCDLGKSVRMMAGIGLFVALFLWFFEPFGLSRYPGNQTWLAASFGIITFISGLIVEILEIKVFRINKEHPSWRFKHWLLSAIAVLLVISLGNFLFVNYLSEWNNFSLTGFISNVVNTTGIGIFPIAILGILSMKKNQRSNQEIAEKIKIHSHSHANSEIQLKNNSGDDLSVKLNNILYLEAMQNYVAVNFVDDSGYTKVLIRNTLKQLVESLPEHSLLRCHRSFVVNPDHVAKVSGNSQGLVLTLQSFEQDLEVPVSRNYIPALKSALA